MIRLSIIIPMYNVAPYVERCIRSLEDQDIPKEDYELICINDGSPDNCREIVEKLQMEFPNIELINQENQGVSMARNNGIKHARGEYLLFIDPDDFVRPNSLENPLSFLSNNRIEVGLTGYIILDEQMNEEYSFEIDYNINKSLSGISFFNNYLRGHTEIRDPDRSWAIFFKRSFMLQNGLTYLPNVPYLEDGELMYRVYCLAQKVIFIKDPFYLRTTRPGSATHSNLFHTEKARQGFLKSANNLLNFKIEQCITYEQKTFMNQPIIKFTVLSINSYSGLSYLKKYRLLKKSLKNGPLKKLETKGSSKHYRILGKAYNISLHTFYLQWFIFRLKNYMLRKVFYVKRI